LANFDKLDAEAVVDIMKMFTRSSKIKNVMTPSMSNAACELKDALAKDPYSLLKMNNLAHQYWKEGLSEQCLNVLMKGWKRAGEISDEHVRFRFLMRICELSFGYWKYKQALAVFRDITEPVDEKFLRPYLILGTQVWAANGDLQQSLKFFQRSIEGQSFKVAVRVFAIVCLELQKAGAFEAAKAKIESLADERAHEDPDILMVSHFLEAQEERKKEDGVILFKQRGIVGVTIGISVMLLLSLLYYLERSSLASLKAA
jgi:tetratricopeptide (TPR) repeat protein